MKKLLQLFSRTKVWLKNSFETWKQKARTLKRQTYTVYLAYKDPRVPWYVKLLAVLVVGYAFSPVDLIPDFIPVLGYLDDLILVPLGLKLVIKLIPKEILLEYQEKAEAEFKGKPRNWYAAIFIFTIWVLAIVWFGLTIWRISHRKIICNSCPH